MLTNTCISHLTGDSQDLIQPVVASYPAHILKQLHRNTAKGPAYVFPRELLRQMSRLGLLFTTVTVAIPLEMVPNLIISILLDFFSLTITGCDF